jgi:6-phospho-beta-glucosidase
MSRKIALIGGGGVRTPLLVHGLAQAQSLLDIEEFALFDVDRERTEVMARLAREIVRKLGADFRIVPYDDLESAVGGAEFVLGSIRVGGIQARATDERMAIEHGLAGQETTGPGGVAMALRTVPIAIAQAKIVERAAPDSWFINFSNPAGLITQALTDHTGLRVVGICDTPIELFHRISEVLGEPYHEMQFDYMGLNHLGWVKRVRLRGDDVTERLLSDPAALARLYPANLFDPELIQVLRLIPAEYLFFYYNQRKAYNNQVRSGASRGEELVKMNAALFDQLGRETPVEALATYTRYLLQRNASYMKLEGEGGSAFSTAEEHYDPFETATGYHRIALDVIRGLLSETPRQVVVNVQNRGAITDLDWDDIVEVPCDIDTNGPFPRKAGALPESVRGLVMAVKAYERAAIRAAVEQSRGHAELAMLQYPIIGDWGLARSLGGAMARNDPGHLGFLANGL